MRPGSQTQLANQLSVSSFVLFTFCFLEGAAFIEYFVLLPFPLCMESTSYAFPLPDGVFLPYDHGLDFRDQLILCEDSIDQSKPLK